MLCTDPATPCDSHTPSSLYGWSASTRAWKARQRLSHQRGMSWTTACTRSSRAGSTPSSHIDEIAQGLMRLWPMLPITTPSSDHSPNETSLIPGSASADPAHTGRRKKLLTSEQPSCSELLTICTGLDNA
ncbi:hypothetical protein LIA77_04576 [Sarocladium implicatum]|nr:hypothetical protein LIA77_04576 [Sarocladium implicatum]